MSEKRTFTFDMSSLSEDEVEARLQFGVECGELFQQAALRFFGERATFVLTYFANGVAQTLSTSDLPRESSIAFLRYSAIELERRSAPAIFIPSEPTPEGTIQ